MPLAPALDSQKQADCRTMSQKTKNENENTTKISNHKMLKCGLVYAKAFEMEQIS